MTSSEIRAFRFDSESVESFHIADERLANWPVVYTLNDSKRVYVGETINAIARMRQHLGSPERRGLTCMRIVLDRRFNKSACLDLESHLIRLFSGDGGLQVINRNDGITNAEYYDRASYLSQFQDVFDALRNQGLFTRSIADIENSDLFKYSPFKALNTDQALAVHDIIDGILEALTVNEDTTSVVNGEPGTGKTIVAVFLIKLLRDIASMSADDETDRDSVFADLFVPDVRDQLERLRIGFVVPQQSLRKTVKKVFKRTPALSASMVLSPFEVGADDTGYDILIVDEAHRLTQRANQASGPLNKKYREITEKLFGFDDKTRTQLDWIKAKSRHRIFLLDVAQSVRPADLSQALLSDLELEAHATRRKFRLRTQMRVHAGEDYIGYVDDIVHARASDPKRFQEYDLRLYDDLPSMISAIHQCEGAFGLSRLLAGYAWPWRSKKIPTDFDIVIDEVKLRWNGKLVDWVNSPTSLNEVGSIHTIQGYDLNFAGVIIGKDIRYDPTARRMYFDRTNYHDSKGMENNKALDIMYQDDDLLSYVQNIYKVLLTRGIRGTFVYAEDPTMREYLSQFLPAQN